MLHEVIKRVSVQGTVPQFVAIGIDRIVRYSEETRYHGRIIYTETPEGRYAELSVQHRRRRGDNLLVRSQNGVDILNIVGEQQQERTVKHIIEFLRCSSSTEPDFI